MKFWTSWNERIQVKLFLKLVNSIEVLEFLKGANSSKVDPKMGEFKWGFGLPEMS